jgi:prefoldin subunit 5
MQDIKSIENQMEQEFTKMLNELQDLEKKIQELNVTGIRINEELAASVEILKNQIEKIDTK